MALEYAHDMNNTDPDESSLVGPDGTSIRTEPSFGRRTLRRVASFFKSSKSFWLFLGVAVMWMWDHRDDVVDLAFGRHAEVNVADVDTNQGLASITMVNEGDKPTVVTSARIDITRVANVKCDPRRFTIVFETKRLDTSHTYHIDLDSVEPPLTVEVGGFRHALVPGEADSFSLDFKRTNLVPRHDSETRNITVAFRAHVTFSYDGVKQAVSPPFVVQFPYKVVSYGLTDEEAQKQISELEKEVSELYEGITSVSPRT